MGFNLDDYETVETRLNKFWTDYTAGRVNTWQGESKDGEWVIVAELYRHADDTHPMSNGHAHEVQGAGNVNQASALENCETSAIGRALANAGYATSGKRPSREEMLKVQRHQRTRIAQFYTEAQQAASREDMLAVHQKIKDGGLMDAEIDDQAGTLGAFVLQRGKALADEQKPANDEPEQVPEQTAWDNPDTTDTTPAQEPPGWDMAPAN